MKNWLKEYANFFKGWQFKVGIGVFVALLIAGIFIGFQIYGYIMAVAVFVLFYYFSLQAQAERIVSPKEIQQMEEDLRNLIEEASFIQQHIEENPSDLEAKLLLRELEKEIQVLEDALPKEE